MKPKYYETVKALKRAAREDFGFQPTHITSNKRKYVRSREKRLCMKDIDYLPASA